MKTAMKHVEASRTTGSQEEIQGLIKVQKSANTSKKMTDIKTLACYMKEIGKNVKVENLPAA